MSGLPVDQRQGQEKTPLMLASQLGQTERVRALLEAGAGVEDASKHGGTALMLASLNGHAACVRAIVAAGADVDRVDEYGQTALMQASHYGCGECVRALLEARAAVDRTNAHGGTALMLASHGGHGECVAALLGGGAAVDRVEERGMSALMLAALKGRTECVRALLEAGADVLRADSACASALEHGKGELGVVQLLCAYGARRATLLEHDPELEGVPERCAAWLRATSRWSSPLHYLELLPPSRVRALVAAGADLDASDGLSADAPTPRTLARALLTRDRAHECAALVAGAAAPWCRHNHALFPQAARARARELARLGRLLALQEGPARGPDGELALRDAWEHHVMAHAVTRCVPAVAAEDAAINL